MGLGVAEWILHRLSMQAVAIDRLRQDIAHVSSIPKASCREARLDARVLFQPAMMELAGLMVDLKRAYCRGVSVVYKGGVRAQEGVYMTASPIHHIQARSTIRIYSPAYLFHSTCCQDALRHDHRSDSCMISLLRKLNSHPARSKFHQWQGLPAPLRCVGPAVVTSTKKGFESDALLEPLETHGGLTAKKSRQRCNLRRLNANL